MYDFENLNLMVDCEGNAILTSNRKETYDTLIIKSATKAQLIETIGKFPDAAYEHPLPASPALDLLRTHYQTLALGLKAYELDDEVAKSEFLFTDRVLLKPDVELSRALLVLCQEVFDRSTILQASQSGLVLWFACEMSTCKYHVRNAGIVGTPDTNQKGRFLGKSEALKRLNQTLTAAEKVLLSGEPTLLHAERDQAKKPNLSELMTNVVLATALQIVTESNDDSLSFQVSQYLRAVRQHAKMTECSESRQFVRFWEGEVRITGKHKKSLTPKVQKRSARGFGDRKVS